MTKFICNRCNKERRGLARCADTSCRSFEFRIVRCSDGEEGCNKEGCNKEGCNKEGCNKEGCNKESG